jgi:hypothetical protein
MQPSQISKIHRETGDSIDGLEVENVKLKERIKELENALMPLPILECPLSMVKPNTLSIKLKGSSILLIAVRSYVEKNIKNRMSLIIEAWELAKNIVSFGSKEHVFHEYLQADLKNEEGFYTNVVLPFETKFSNMTELKRREEDLPYPSLIKQLNVCWKEKTRNLNNIVEACNKDIVKREELFRRLTEVELVGITNEVQYPYLILNSMFMTRKQFDEQVEILKGLSATKLNGTKEIWRKRDR